MLTETQNAELCMMMRVVSFLQSNMNVIGSDPEILEALDGLKAGVGQILESVGEAERNLLLEQYQAELEMLGLNG